MPVFFDAFAAPALTPAPVVNMEEFQQMARRVAEIEELLTRHVGPVYGGTQNNPHPRQQRFYREVHGPLRQSIDSTHSVTFTVDYDTLATQLYQAKLTFRLAAVRANLSTAASGGSSSPSTTSGGSQTPTTTSGGSQTPTTAAGGSSTPTSSATGTHHHTVGEYYADPGLATEAGGTGATGGGSGGGGTSHAHSSSAASWSVDATALTNNNNVDAHTHTGPSHTHGLHDVRYYTVGSAKVLGMFLASGASTTDFTTFSAASNHDHTVTIASHQHTVTIAAHDHTVTIAAHDHTVTIAAHTHSLTFTTIQEGSAPSAPAVTITINGVDVTTALGGPFNSSQSNLDVTSYLRTTAGEPIRGDNVFVFTSTELLDFEVVVKAFLGASDPWSVGAISA